MNEHPIIFSAEMVRAILADRKTQTRRIIKPQPNLSKDGYRWCWKGKEIGTENPIEYILLDRCTYGKKGERLWVREKFTIGGNGYFYTNDFDGSVKVAWSSPIHMPRKASRITLEITKIRVERLQEITDADVKAEGISAVCIADHNGRDLQRPFSFGWDHLNSKRGFSWESNPWVWVIEFKKI